MNQPTALIRVLLAATAALWLASCDGGGGGSSDSGSPDNGNSGVVVCIGDSITEGRSAPAGAPYPARLAGLCGKTVINAGRGGAKSGRVAADSPAIIAKHHPGYVCLMIGANDAVAAAPGSYVAENVRRVIQAAKAEGSRILVGTVTPTFGPHGYSNDNVDEINAAIRAVVKDEGARLVDVNAEFGTDKSFLQSDGLHPSDSGTQLIAMAFNDKL